MASPAVQPPMSPSQSVLADTEHKLMAAASSSAMARMVPVTASVTHGIIRHQGRVLGYPGRYKVQTEPTEVRNTPWGALFPQHAITSLSLYYRKTTACPPPGRHADMVLYKKRKALYVYNAMRHRAIRCLVKPRAVWFQRYRPYRGPLRGLCQLKLTRMLRWLKYI